MKPLNAKGEKGKCFCGVKTSLKSYHNILMFSFFGSQNCTSKARKNEAVMWLVCGSNIFHSLIRACMQTYKNSVDEKFT